MAYQDTLNWMFAQLPMYQKQGKSALKKDLKNTLLLAKHLENPESQFKSIHVAGTNGKGSTSHMIASVLQEAGYKVGLYTSPHLKDFRERIKINGIPISKNTVTRFINTNKHFLEANNLSFFELTVGMAFSYFAKKKVDIAVIEVGLGGRLDSTNIIIPEVAVITNIGLDHTQFLGTTLPEIALEKAGIIKANVPVVIGETATKTKTIFKEEARKKKAPIFFADQLVHEVFATDLKGNYQKKNVKTAVETVRVLQEREISVSKQNIKSGLLHVVQNTGLLGRWQQLQQQPKVICDTAHNKEGLSYTMQQVEQEKFENLHLVFGVVNDKDLDAIITVLPKNATYYFCKPNVPRGMPELALKQYFLKNGFHGKSYTSVQKAYLAALQETTANDFIYVGGSTFVVAEII